MGRAIVLDNNVNTDQIISGEHVRLETYTQHLFQKFRPEITELIQSGEIVGSILVAGRNFGSGSSRERAAIGLKEVGIEAVVATSYNPIWERNAVNCGLRTYRVEPRALEEISDGDDLEISSDERVLYDRTTRVAYSLMETPNFVRSIWDVGGLTKYVGQKYMEGR